MRSTSRTRVAVATAIATLGGAAAVAAVSPTGPASAAPAVIQTIHQQMSLFRESPATPLASQKWLKARFERAGDVTSPLAGATWGEAHPVSVPGASSEAWVVPVGDRVCIASPVPKPAGAFGITCSTADDVAKGNAYSIIVNEADASEPNTVIALVPDSTSAPTVTTGSGKTLSLPVASNVAVGKIAPTGALKIADNTVDLGSLAK